MIHPFHPRFGQSFLLVHHGRASGEDRVLLQGTDGITFWLLTRWTNLAVPDPWVALAEGRARLRAPDLALLAGILALPEEPFEAATIDGASGFQSFWYLELPMLRPMIFIAVVFRFIDSLKTFDIIWVMTGGGPGYSSTTLNILAFRTGFEFLHMGSAAAIAVLMVILAIGVTKVLVGAGELQK